MRIYVAGKYGRRNDLSREECEENARKAFGVAKELVELGHVPFVPHMYHYVHIQMDPPIHEDRWLEICKAWLPFCHALFLMEGSEDSIGAMSEFEDAKALGLWIFTSIAQVPKVLKE